MAERENQNIPIAEAIGGPSIIRFYGRPISGAQIEAAALAEFSAESKGLPQLALIHSTGIGTFCRVLPSPVILLMPPGGKPAGEDRCARPGDYVWHLPPRDRTLLADFVTGTVEELLDEIETRGIKGGVRLDNPRIQNGKACVDVHIWAEIKIFGKKVSVDERFPICVPLSGCHTVWEAGIASVKVCFKAPNRLCAELCVGKWGISKCWDACIDLPISAEAEAGADKCRCVSPAV